MAKQRELKVVIAGDARGLTGATDEANGSLGRLGGAAATAGAAVAAGLAAAAAGLVAVGGQFDAAYDTIRVGTGATGEALSALQDDFRAVASDVPASFGDVSTVVADLNTRLGLTGQPLQDLSGQFLDLARITGGDVATSVADVTRVFGDWAIDDQAGSLDAMFRASQATGAGMEQLSGQLVQFGAPLRQLGFGFEDSLAVLGQFEKEGVNTELVLGSMRQALGRMARDGEPAAETFSRVTDEIKNAGSASEANALALELFGARAGPDMAAAIREGRFEVGELTDAIANGSETIGTAADDTASWQESWLLFKNNALLAIEPIATRVFSALGSFMESVTPSIIAFGESAAIWIEGTVVPAFDQLGIWWADNGPAITETVTAVAAGLADAFVWISDAVADVLSWFTTTFGEDSPVGEQMGGFTESVAGWTEQISAIWVSATEAWNAAVVWFTDAATMLWERYGEDLVELIAGAMGVVEQLITSVLSVIRGVFEVFAGIFTGDWDRVWTAVKDIFKALWDAIVAVLEQALRGLQLSLRVALDAIAALWGVIWGGIKDVFSQIWQAIVGIFTDRWNDLRGHYDSVTRALSGAWDTFTGLLGSAWDGLWEGVTSAFSTRWAAMRSVFDAAKGALEETWGGFAETMTGIWSGIWSGIETGFGTVRSNLETTFGGLVTALSTIWDGVRAVLAAPVNWVADNVINELSGAVNRVSSALGAGNIAPILATPLVTFHEGGVVGRDGRLTSGPLRPGERLIKAQDGEEVLTAEDPRHANNVQRGEILGDPTSPDVQIASRGTAAPTFAGVGSFVSGLSSSIKDAAYGLLSEARQLIANTVRPLLNGLTSTAMGAAERFGPVGQVVAGAGTRHVDEALDWLAGVDDDVEDAIGASGLGRGLEWARSQVGKPYLWGGVGPAGYDCSGFLSALTNIILGRSPHSRIMTSASIIDGRGGRDFRPGGDGDFTIGSFKGNPGHVAGTLLDTNVESAGGVGVRVGPSARGTSWGRFTHRFSLAGALADGGTTTIAGRYLVGEQGPEVLDLPAQSTVIPLGGAFGPGFTSTFDPFAPTGATIYDDLAALVTGTRQAAEQLVDIWSTTAAGVAAEVTGRFNSFVEDVAQSVATMTDDIDSSLEDLAGATGDFADATTDAATTIAAAATRVREAAAAAAAPPRPAPPTPAPAPAPAPVLPPTPEIRPDHFGRIDDRPRPVVSPAHFVRMASR